MLSYIKRKLSESDTSGSNVQDNTTTNNCDVSHGQSDNNNKISTNNNSGSGNGSGVVGTVLDTLIRKASQMSLIKQSSSIDQAIAVGQDALLQDLGYKNATELRETIYDLLRTIRDPEKPATLEDLNVVYEEGIFVQPPTQSNVYVVRIEFNPTVPHCSLATLIGLCIRIKIERSLPHMLKLDIYIKKGMHNTEDEINKQVNDKERVAAAMENPNLYNLVENCIKEDD